MGRVCELVLVVMVTVLSHHLAVASHPFLRDECLVKDKEENKFSTFDDNIILHLAAIDDSQDVTVTAKQGSYEIKPKIGKMKLLTWFKLELSLDSENPTCLLNKNNIDCAMENTSNSMREKKWEVEVVGAVFYVGCPEEMPVFVVKEGEGASFNIPRSGNEEVLKLLPTADTSINVSVGGKEKLVCRGENGNGVLMDLGNSPCQPLKKDEFTGHDSAQITVTDEGGTGDNTISFSPTNLKGLLYIVQCTKGCRVPGKGITTTPTRITTTPQEEGKGITTTPTRITTTSTTTTSNTTTPKKGEGWRDSCPVAYGVAFGVVVVNVVILAAAFIYVFSLQGDKSKSNPIPRQPNPVPAGRPIGGGAIPRVQAIPRVGDNVTLVTSEAGEGAEYHIYDEVESVVLRR